MMYGAAARTAGDHHALVAQPSHHNVVVDGVDNEVVWINGTRNYGLPKTWAGVDHGFIPAAGDRVGGEYHARCRRVDHVLHDDGKRHAAMIDAVRIAVADSAVGPQRSPTATDRIEQCRCADHIEVGVLLPGEAGVSEVLGGGG